ncbi:MAG: hypothetical protein ABFD79_05120 [Phycisphaerales bacterium]
MQKKSTFLRDSTIEDKLKSGDIVVVPALSARNASFLAGLIAGGFCGWMGKHNFLTAIELAISGAIVGFIAGMVIGKILFFREPGKVMVVKKGPKSIITLIKGNVIGCLITGISVFNIAFFFMEVNASIILLSIFISFVIGIIMAVLGSLL